MSILIPTYRVANQSAPRPVLFSGNQEGSLGGPSLPIPRMGDRFALDVQIGQLRNDADGRQLIAALTQATTADAIFAFLQPNLPGPPSAGVTVVDGAGQGGTTLNVRGGNAGAVLAWGRFLSIVHGGRRYVHMLTGNVAIGGDGRAALPIWPMLRFISTDGDAVELDAPKIEGQLIGFDGKGATFERNRTNPVGFTIQERA